MFALGAAFIQRTTGFGFGIFIMTMLPYLMPSYGEATALSGMLAMITSLIISIRYRSFIPWRKLVVILTTFLVVSFLAIQLIPVLSGKIMRIILGITLIAAAIYFWFFSDKIRMSTGIGTQMSLGVISGSMGGLFGMQGPPAVLYFLSACKDKDEYTALCQTYFLIGNVVMTFYRANSGFLTETVIVSWFYGVPAVLLGTWIGGRVYDRLTLPVLRKVVYVYIAISGIVALIK